MKKSTKDAANTSLELTKNGRLTAALALISLATSITPASQTPKPLSRYRESGSGQKETSAAARRSPTITATSILMTLSRSSGAGVKSVLPHPELKEKREP